MNERITTVSMEKLKKMKGTTHWAKLVAEEKAANKPQKKPQIKK